MPLLNLKSQTRQELLDIPVPLDEKIYKAVSLASLFDTIDELSKAQGWALTKEHLQTQQKGMQQKLRFAYDTGDSKFLYEVGVLNSYNKTMSLKCSGGASVALCFNGQCVGDYSIQERHVTDVREDMYNFMKAAFSNHQTQIGNAHTIWNAFNSCEINQSQMQQLVGDLYLTQDLLNTEQLQIVKEAVYSENPYEDCNPTSLNFLYQAVTLAGRGTHPLRYAKDRKCTQDYFTKVYTEFTDIPLILN